MIWPFKRKAVAVRPKLVPLPPDGLRPDEDWNFPDMRSTPVDNPLDYRADGSIRKGDPAYDALMEIMDSGKPAIFNQKDDGTWEKRDVE